MLETVPGISKFLCLAKSPLFEPESFSFAGLWMTSHIIIFDDSY